MSDPVTTDPMPEDPFSVLPPTIAEAFAAGLRDKVLKQEMIKDEAVIWVRRDDILTVMAELREYGRLEQLIDVTAVDYPDRPERFEVVYQLLSVTGNVRLRIKCTTDENTPVPSVVSIYPSANWFEREVWDMYGVMFSGHPDHRRILTDYGFDGHPLRKDFPLTGYVEVRYDQEQKRVIYEPVKLPQDFRNFDYLSPWEGLTDVQLPGDEKATKPKTGWQPASKATE